MGSAASPLPSRQRRPALPGRRGAARPLLRRDLLGAAISVASVAVLAAARASAQQKVSQTEAQYQDRPKNGLDCAACALFRPPAACAVVSGIISPNGWCRFFDLPD